MSQINLNKVSSEEFAEGSWRDLEDGRWVCYRRGGTVRCPPFAISGLEIRDSELDLTIVDQSIKALTVSGSKFGGKLENVQFSNCNFSRVNFYSELENVQFSNCTFKGGTFTPHVKEGEGLIDLSTCVFEGCTVEVRVDRTTTFAGNPDMGAWLDY